MRRRTDRILTTHCGSLPRPPEVMPLLTDRALGRPVDEAEFDRCSGRLPALIN